MISDAQRPHSASMAGLSAFSPLGNELLTMKLVRAVARGLCHTSSKS
jgi:hypothetical protein